MNAKGKRVLLLRAPSKDTPDRYEVEFNQGGYVPISVPVLETVFENLGELRERIGRGSSASGVDGVVMTSKRSVEAWGEAVRVIAKDEDYDRDRDREVDWRNTPFYVVGEATAGAARKIGEAFPQLGRFVPVDIRGGSETGNAERLARFILGDLCGGDVKGRKLLYLTGDKNMETLPQILEKEDVGLDELEVYRTSGSSTFGDDLRDALESAGGEKDEDWGWVVHFAPSAAAFVTPFLRDAFRFSGDTVVGKPLLRVAAIGPSTASSLRDTLKLHVDVVSPKPSPDSLAKAILAVDSA